jgi:hypothetical protein
MSTDHISINLQTNIRKLEPASDFKLQNVLHCQVTISHEKNIGPEEMIPVPEHQAVRRATMKYIAKSPYVLSTIDKEIPATKQRSKALGKHALSF